MSTVAPDREQLLPKLGRAQLALQSVSGANEVSSGVTGEETNARTNRFGAKDGILRSLYKRRTELQRMKRLDGLSEGDAAFLDDLNEYIDTLETEPRSDVWAQLDAIAASVVAVHADLERKPR